jgi:hypothetical protein
VNILFADIITLAELLLPFLNKGIIDGTQFKLSLSCTLGNIGWEGLLLSYCVYNIEQNSTLQFSIKNKKEQKTTGNQ